MGHDINAYKIEGIAHHRRNAFSESNRYMYIALGVEHLHAGVSGNGGCDIFFKDGVERALEWFAYNHPEEKDSIDFLKTCLVNMVAGKVLISFW